MHNLKEIRKNFDNFKKSLEKRYLTIDIHNLENLDKKNRELIQKKENLEKEKKKFDDKKNKKIKNFSKKRKIELQSYKIIFILKDVDPKDPTEELSSILSNSDVNFEIEKIERILDSKNKSMNKN